MADHAPNFTARYRVRYTTGDAIHTQTWRFPGNGDGPEFLGARAAVEAYYAALADGLWSDFAVISAAVALRGSDIFLPALEPGAGGSVDPTVLRRKYHKASVLSFVGRTALGKRAIIFQYGFEDGVGDAVEADDFRFVGSENAFTFGAYNALQAAGADLCGNDGEAITWYPYANVSVNAYWKGKVRNG